MSETQRPRVHVMAETQDTTCPNACAALRVLDPFSCSPITDRFDVSVGAGPPADAVEILVLQRLGSVAGTNAEIEDLVWSLKNSGTKLLYDIDDNLLDPHPDADSERTIAAHRRSVRLLLREADHVTVSTATLRDRVQHLNPRVSLLPNALDERRLKRAPAAPLGGEGLRIGYFGTFTHLRDLMGVAGSLRAAFSMLPHKATFVFCGISQDTRILSLFDDVATAEVMPATGDYQSFIDAMLSRAPWDIGLAPLATGQFESTKSDIKFLEHAAFGVAGLYADHPAYATVQQGVTGMVAAPDAWADCILTLANDPALRARIVSASREYLLSQRTLATASRSLAAILKQLLLEPR
jgi:processive 1,2-diacylglycerol beta-glucosyltransferase